ncbi:twin-arginine translocation signal domain-containing protein [Natrinema sp. DC36]|uniref:twin-arginine translocation signal domain-containing protein n=1 Tax=Natrinema sp. DC36 TaxID=2878680 RepID=UPI001CEFC64B|nr:twin-arginine translocation signal domain-containing protein [Natrinema sp. DC36]
MTVDAPDVTTGPSSRRRFLGAAATVGTTAVAGCVGSLLDTSDSNEIEPEEPSEPRKGTPGEFYTLVERNDIPVESLRWDGSDLVLRYDSSASTESESTTEIEVITTVYNENLVKNDAEVDMLYAEVTEPFDGQAYGWGVKTEWCKQYNAAVADSEGGDNETGSDDDGSTDSEGDTEESDGSNETESDGNSTDTTDSDGNSTDTTDSDGNSTDTTDSDGNSTDTTDSDASGTEDGTSSVSRAAMVLMSNVLNTRVYEDDVEN